MTIAFRHHQGIGMPRNCEESVYFYQRAAEKAVSWWESGPPGGHYLPRNAYRLADDMGGVYGEGASAVSAGPNAHRNRQSYETAKDVEEYMEYMELFARKGAVPETVILAKRYYDGHRNVPRDVVRAKEYFLRVARQYWDRDGKVKPDDQLYMEKFAGTAAGYLGVMALRGEPGPQDYAIAQMWFNRGNTAGDANSQNWLGYMYLNGLGVKQDRKRARTYFQAAMLQDWPTAQVNYAKMLLESGEFTEAKRYMESAGRHGNIEAIYYLAVIINSAAPKDRSCTLATIYYKMVVERIEPPQSPIAWANEAYENGDLESALIGYMMAAEQGYESAQANVAYLLDDKQPALSLRELVYPTTTPPTTPEQANKTRIEKELALIYWTRSAKQSNIDSLVKMGDYYLSGIGTEMDPAKAASCYSAAAEHQASAQALWNLGWMHENGVGVSQDFHLAKRYYDLSFESNPEAYLPVTLSLFKLRARAFWNAITHGGIKGIGPDPAKKKVTFREFLRRWYEATARADAVRVQEDELAAANAVREQQLADEFGYVDEELDGDFLESVVILGIAGALAAAIYYRQWRQRRRDEEGRAAAAAAVAAGGQQQQQPLPPLGIWNDPGMPGWGMPH